MKFSKLELIGRTLNPKPTVPKIGTQNVGPNWKDIVGYLPSLTGRAPLSKQGVLYH
jgi:hypothetical protein